MRSRWFWDSVVVLLASFMACACPSGGPDPRSDSTLAGPASSSSFGKEAEVFDGDRVDQYPPFVAQEWFPLGETTEFRSHRKRVRVTVIGHESVAVPVGTFSDCVRIDVARQTDGSETSTVWLAKGVGLIKWRRATGRTDELTEYQTPAS
jgi:hypothetical protein